MPDFDYIGYEVIDGGRIAVITLDRPKQRNAQNRGMLVELGCAFELAEMDDEVRVVLLRAAGASFSAGHDLGSSDDVRERSPGPDQHPILPVQRRDVRRSASHATARSGTTSSRTRSDGAICARSPSPRCTAWSCRPA